MKAQNHERHGRRAAATALRERDAEQEVKELLLAGDSVPNATDGSCAIQAGTQEAAGNSNAPEFIVPLSQSALSASYYPSLALFFK